MSRLKNFVKTMLFALVLMATGMAMYPSQSAAVVACWDDGHACHITEDDGTVTHHGRFIDL